MKRGSGRSRPHDIVEVPSARPDPRADPQATQKISRAELDEALRRTKSGTRRAVRSDPDLGDGTRDAGRDSFAGPRDDSPEVTIVRIDSVELDALDPLSLPPNRATPMSSMMSPMVIRTPGTLLADQVAEAYARPSSSSPAPPSSASNAPPSGIPAPHPRVVSRRAWATNRLQITPRAAFLGGLGVALFVLLAAVVGFFAGRIAPGSK